MSPPGLRKFNDRVGAINPGELKGDYVYDIRISRLEYQGRRIVNQIVSIVY